MNAKDVGRLAKIAILLAASLGALSQLMPGAGAKGGRPSSETKRLCRKLSSSLLTRSYSALTLLRR